MFPNNLNKRFLLNLQLASMKKLTIYIISSKLDWFILLLSLIISQILIIYSKQSVLSTYVYLIIQIKLSNIKE
jgi:hypothetical protein